VSTRKIIIDTDPGQDDAIAILLALASAELDVLGITCVAGNVPLSLSTRNALLICELAGRSDMSVFAGCDRPMVRALVTAEAVHGNTGLDGPVWDEPTMSLSAVHAVDWLIETLMESNDGEITVCPVGPLTNIGMALVREPRIAPKIAEIVTMGGAYFVGGNVTPAAEFNVFVDPHAAEVVYRSGIPMVTMSLDVTHRALMSPEWLQSIADIGTTVGEKASQMLSFYNRRDPGRHGERGGPVHDPATIAYLLSPSLYSGKDAHVAIETASELTMGMTVVDYWGRHGGEPNSRWMTEVDSDGFFELIGSRLALL
jgi:purine nucleosidase